ncbi:MAG: PilZ domain-containing protein [Miltoncostaeaceae bacterium]
MCQATRADEAALSGTDRRSFPRIPTDLGVVLESASRRVMGVTVDASEGGLRVAVSEPFFSISAPISVRMNLPDGGWHQMRGEVVRADVEDDGAMLGIRLDPRTAEPTAPAGPPTTRDGKGRKRRVRKSRAKKPKRRPRPRELALAELRALGGHVYEQCILGEEGPPSPSTMEWVSTLAWELDVAGPSEAVETYQQLMRELAALHRRADARAPETPTEPQHA